MEVNAQVWVKTPPPPGAVSTRSPVSIRLSGSATAIASLLKSLEWDEKMAQKLELE